MVFIPSAMHGIETVLGTACFRACKNESPYRAHARIGAHALARRRALALRSRAEMPRALATIERTRRNSRKGIRQPVRLTARNGRRGQ